jgi:hypothetical protein
VWASGPVGQNIHCDNETGFKEGEGTPKVRSELAKILLFFASSCLIQIMKSHSELNPPVLLAEVGPSQFVGSHCCSEACRGETRLLPSKTKLQLLPWAKLRGRVSSV